MQIPLRKRRPKQSEQIYETLKNLLFFKELRKSQPEQTIKNLCQSLKYKKINEGDPIFFQGDSANEFYIILVGEVGIYQHVYEKRQDLLFNEKEVYFKQSKENFLTLTLEGEMEIMRNTQPNNQNQNLLMPNNTFTYIRSPKTPSKQIDKIEDASPSPFNNLKKQKTQDQLRAQKFLFTGEAKEQDLHQQMKDKINSMQKEQQQKILKSFSNNFQTKTNVFKKKGEHHKYVNLLNYLQQTKHRPQVFQRHYKKYLQQEKMLYQLRQPPLSIRNQQYIKKDPSKFTEKQLFENIFKRYIQLLAVYTAGQQFGEIALDLNYSKSRTASVIATETTHLAYLDRSDYKNLIRNAHLDNLEEKVGIKDNMSLFNNIPLAEIRDIFSFMQTKYVPQGKVVYNQEDSSENFYIVRQGSFEISIEVNVLDKTQTQFYNYSTLGKNHKFIKDYHGTTHKNIKLGLLSKYQYFGHQELLQDSPQLRMYTITSKSNDGELLFMNLIDFYQRFLQNDMIKDRLTQQARLLNIMHQKKLQQSIEIQQNNKNLLMQTNFDKNLSHKLKEQYIQQNNTSYNTNSLDKFNTSLTTFQKTFNINKSSSSKQLPQVYIQNTTYTQNSIQQTPQLQQQSSIQSKTTINLSPLKNYYSVESIKQPKRANSVLNTKIYHLNTSNNNIITSNNSFNTTKYASNNYNKQDKLSPIQIIENNCSNNEINNPEEIDHEKDDMRSKQNSRYYLKNYHTQNNFARQKSRQKKGSVSVLPQTPRRKSKKNHTYLNLIQQQHNQQQTDDSDIKQKTIYHSQLGSLKDKLEYFSNYQDSINKSYSLLDKCQQQQKQLNSKQSNDNQAQIILQQKIQFQNALIRQQKIHKEYTSIDSGVKSQKSLLSNTQNNVGQQYSKYLKFKNILENIKNIEQKRDQKILDERIQTINNKIKKQKESRLSFEAQKQQYLQQSLTINSISNNNQ